MDPTLASRLDHTLLRPDATAADIDRLCAEAREHGFAAVCVNPSWVARAAAALEGTEVRVCAVVGFPLGATSSEAKAAEARQAVADGARELDMVINLGALKSGDDGAVRDDVAAVAEVAHAGGARLKAILEVGALVGDEFDRAARAALAGGADYLKTSTGFGPGGATVEAVRRLRALAGGQARVKAAGGIRDRRTALELLEAGADRLGASASVAIVLG